MELDSNTIQASIKVQTSDNPPVDPQYGDLFIYKDGTIKSVNDQNQLVDLEIADDSNNSITNDPISLWKQWVNNWADIDIINAMGRI